MRIEWFGRQQNPFPQTVNGGVSFGSGHYGPMIEARRKSDQPWPRACDEKVQL